jgi:GntR family transcriptional regulator
MLARHLLPLHYQLTNLLRHRILAGEWAPGTRLPTEDDLTRAYGVSRLTVRRAKASLARQGLIRSRQGSGSYLTSPDAWKANPFTVETIDDLLALGRDMAMAFKIREFRVVPNSPAVAEKLANPGDRFVFRLSGVRHLRGRPLSHAVHHLPFDLGSRVPPQLLSEEPFVPQFEQLAGIRVADARQSICAGGADRTAARHLGVRPGAPVLVVETTYLDARRRPVQFVRAQYRDEFRYNIRLRRKP